METCKAPKLKLTYKDLSLVDGVPNLPRRGVQKNLGWWLQITVPGGQYNTHSHIPDVAGLAIFGSRDSHVLEDP